ncbi:MAG TPA: hypothetical protein VJV21_00715 [Pyrinomonadaceae bacterium]|nr:hypothetical protein [Pyrinomonadaceae bacterium]
MSTEDDRVRLIAERVARRVAGPGTLPGSERENGFDRHETSAPSESGQPAETPRARVINFISSGPPAWTASSIATHSKSAEQLPQSSSKASSEFFQFIPATQSPWLGRLPAMLANQNPHSVDHPSEQRFGVEEATVAELVEFFEKEKKCSMDPSGKPCDHCAMCSSRGF